MKKLFKRIFGEDRWLHLVWAKGQGGTVFGLFSFVESFLVGFRYLRVKNPFETHSLYIRPGTADEEVYQEIFKDNEYNLDLGNPKVIVDGGAHIGFGAVYFASKYPNSKVIAIEPESENYRLLKRNTRAYENITSLQSGVWSTPASIKIESSDVGTWSFRVIETTENDPEAMRAIDIPTVMKEFQLEHIDVLKLDVEGSEIEIFETSHKWLERVETIIVELHDRFRPGCRQALDSSLKEYQFDESSSGESVVITNLRRRLIDDCESRQ